MFDTLDHKILLEKMVSFDFKMPVIKCFESYLSNTKFVVSVNNAFSETGILNFDLLQESIPGPLLFLIINECFKPCECFDDKKLAIHFGENKTKCSLFSKTKRLLKLDL